MGHRLIMTVEFFPNVGAAIAVANNITNFAPEYDGVLLSLVHDGVNTLIATMNFPNPNGEVNMNLFIDTMRLMDLEFFQGQIRRQHYQRTTYERYSLSRPRQRNDNSRW